jgi:hypothetical protein
MERHDLSRIDVDDGGVGIAVERRGVVGHRVDPVVEALDLGAGAHDSGLQPIHVVDAAEDLILERSVVSRGAG